MKVKLMLVVAALGSLALVDAASAQVRYSSPTYRGSTSRAVHYSRSYGPAVEEGGEMGCDAGCGTCDSCRTGCGSCCRPCVLGFVARGVGRMADCLGSTLDCLFPGNACCASSCCEKPCYAKRTRCCARRQGCCERGCDGGCSSCMGGDMMEGPYEEHQAVPRAAKPEAPSPAPTPEPEASKDARHYRPLPPARTSANKPRSTTTPKQPAASPKSRTVPAAATEEYVAPRAPRTLMVRPTEAKRIVPAYEEEVAEEVEYEPTPAPAPAARTASSRVPVNPLRSR